MSLVGAGIAAGASLAGQGISALTQSNLNRKNRKFAREMWEKQGARELQFWHMQNAYNDPLAQMQRLSNAGLNPNLVYGSGATTEAAKLSAASAQTPSTRAPELDLGSVVQQGLMARQLQSNIARTDAETNRINEMTADQNFKNSVNRMVGVENIARAQQAANEYLESRSNYDRFKYEAEIVGLFTTPEGEAIRTDDPNSPVAKAARAGAQKTLVELENAKHLGDIRRFEAVIKEFESNLAKQGISPNSPFYVKIVGDLIDRIFPGWLNILINGTDNKEQSTFPLTPQIR